MRLALTFLAVVVLASGTEVPAQDRSQDKDPQYYHFLMQNCPGKNLKITLKNGQKRVGTCQAQLVDRVQITQKGVTYDIPYTDIAKMKRNRSWVNECFDKVKGTASGAYFYVYLIGAMLTSRDKEPW